MPWMVSGDFVGAVRSKSSTSNPICIETGLLGGAAAESQRLQLLDPVEHLLREFLPEDGRHARCGHQDAIHGLRLVQRVLARVIFAQLFRELVYQKLEIARPRDHQRMILHVFRVLQSLPQRVRVRMVQHFLPELGVVQLDLRCVRLRIELPFRVDRAAPRGRRRGMAGGGLIAGIRSIRGDRLHEREKPWKRGSPRGSRRDRG